MLYVDLLSTLAYSRLSDITKTRKPNCYRILKSCTAKREEKPSKNALDWTKILQFIVIYCQKVDGKYKTGLFSHFKGKNKRIFFSKKILKVAVIKCCHKPEKIVTGKSRLGRVISLLTIPATYSFCFFLFL